MKRKIVLLISFIIFISCQVNNTYKKEVACTKEKAQAIVEKKIGKRINYFEIMYEKEDSLEYTFKVVNKEFSKKDTLSYMGSMVRIDKYYVQKKDCECITIKDKMIKESLNNNWNY